MIEKIKKFGESEEWIKRERNKKYRDDQRREEYVDGEILTKQESLVWSKSHNLQITMIVGPTLLTLKIYRDVLRVHNKTFIQ